MHFANDSELQSYLLTTREVDLQNCPKLGDPALQTLTHNHNLHSLRWIANPGATPSGHLLFASKAHLRSLNVSGCAQFTDQACQKHLLSPTLHSLDVSFCPLLTDEAFSHIQSPLEFLNIQGCTALTDKTLDHLSHLKSLKYLFLAFNDRFTPAALKKLHLQTLKMYP